MLNVQRNRLYWYMVARTPLYQGTVSFDFTILIMGLCLIDLRLMGQPHELDVSPHLKAASQTNNAMSNLIDNAIDACEP